MYMVNVLCWELNNSGEKVLESIPLQDIYKNMQKKFNGRFNNFHMKIKYNLHWLYIHIYKYNYTTWTVNEQDKNI